MGALGQVFLGLGQGHAVNPLLVWLAKVDRHLLHRSRDEQEIGFELLRQQAAGEILIDHRRRARILAFAHIHHRDAAAADRDHHHASVHQGIDRLKLDDLFGQRRSHHPPPAAPGIFHHRPAHLGLAAPGLRLIHKAANRLAGLLEGRVGLVHQHLGDDGGNALLDAAAVQLVLQRLLQGVADGALAVGPAHIQRHLVHAFYLGGNLRAAQDEAHLRAVAVTDGHVPACLDHVCDVVGGFFCGLVLIFNRLTFLVFDQRVAANSNDGDLSFGFFSH